VVLPLAMVVRRRNRRDDIHRRSLLADFDGTFVLEEFKEHLAPTRRLCTRFRSVSGDSTLPASRRDRVPLVLKHASSEACSRCLVAEHAATRISRRLTLAGRSPSPVRLGKGGMNAGHPVRDVARARTGAGAWWRPPEAVLGLKAPRPCPLLGRRGDAVT
jgi:hypothetical protein